MIGNTVLEASAGRMEFLEAVSLVSLDLARRFQKEIGFSIQESTNQAVRSVIRDHWEFFTRCYDQHSLFAVRDIHRSLSERLGVEWIQRFDCWFENVFYVYSDWAPYEWVISDWIEELCQGDEELNRCGIDARQLRDQFRDLRDYDFERQVEEARLAVLSEWDAEVFVLRKYTIKRDEIGCKAGDDDCGVDFEDPLWLVQRTSDIRLLQQFWRYLLPSLTPELAMRLWGRAKRTPIAWYRGVRDPRELRVP